MSERPLPVHTTVEPFPTEDNCLVIGGQPVTALALRAGQTPFFAYDRGLIDARIRRLRDAMPERLELHYAIKANPMPAVVQFIADRVDGLDIASGRELRVALDTGTDPREVSFAGPGKKDGELQDAIGAGITVTVESATELERVLGIAEAIGRTPHVAVRINPDFELKTSGMKMAGGAKQFGIDAEIAAPVIRRIGEAGASFSGLHIFCGSQNLRAEALVEAQQKTFELVLRLAEDFPGEPDFINLGGGFGIPYFKGDSPLDLAPIGETLQVICDDMVRRFPNTKPVIELGRYIVGEAGVYVCRVIDRKVSRGQVFLVTDGGLHHHLAASGNFGQIIRKNYPLVVANRVFSDELEKQNVVGPLCTPLDLLGDKMDLPRAEPGDLIAVLQSGAYGPTASPAAFLSHPPAVELLC